MNYNTYITFASWEERFIESFRKDVDSNSFDKIIVFYYSNGHHLNIQNKVIENIKTISKKVEIVELTFNNDIKNWKFFKHKLFDNNISDVLLNISTMPRNIIYYLMHFFKEKEVKFEIIYYKALTHSNTLTKNPLNPSLILQHSGIFDLEKPTLLVACVGYDEKRVFQLHNYFEPKSTILLTEEKHQSNVELNLNFDFCLIAEKEEIFINSFIKNNIYDKLNEIYTEKINENNILLCSLGPKISTIEFFKFQVEHPECGLVYVPSKDYCKKYSEGIDLETPIIY